MESISKNNKNITFSINLGRPTSLAVMPKKGIPKCPEPTNVDKKYCQDYLRENIGRLKH